MDIVAILALVEKGISVAEALYAAAQDAGPAITAIGKLIRGQQAGTVTQADMDATDALLDKLIDDFNLEMV